MDEDDEVEASEPRQQPRGKIIGSAPGRFQGTERSVGRIKQRVTTSKVFTVLTVAFLINVTARADGSKAKAKGRSKQRVFFESALTSNVPAWLILLLVMTFLADNPQTGQIAYALAWLILLGSVITNGEKAAKNVDVFMKNINTKGLV